MLTSARTRKQPIFLGKHSTCKKINLDLGLVLAKLDKVIHIVLGLHQCTARLSNRPRQPLQRTHRVAR